MGHFQHGNELHARAQSSQSRVASAHRMMATTQNLGSLSPQKTVSMPGAGLRRLSNPTMTEPLARRSLSKTSPWAHHAFNQYQGYGVQNQQSQQRHHGYQQPLSTTGFGGTQGRATSAGVGGIAQKAGLSDIGGNKIQWGSTLLQTGDFTSHLNSGNPQHIELKKTPEKAWGTPRKSTVAKRTVKNPTPKVSPCLVIPIVQSFRLPLSLFLDLLDFHADDDYAKKEKKGNLMMKPETYIVFISGHRWESDPYVWRGR